MSGIRISSILTGVLFLFAFTISASAADKEAKTPDEKVDSTVMFRQLNETDGSEAMTGGDIFDLPDISLPSSAPKTAPAATKTTAGTSTATGGKTAQKAAANTQNTEDITLPIPMINLGITRSVSSSVGQTTTKAVGKQAEQPVVPDGIPVQNQIDASEFDIAGVYLGMTPQDAILGAIQNGFVLTDVTYTVPKFLEWKYKEVCEKSGFLVYERKLDCVNSLAQEREERYISRIVLEKPELKEKITVSFTSNFGSNIAYRIVYNYAGDYALGTSAEGVFKKRERRKVFWKRVFEKYGWPSDVNEMIWTEGFDKASLRAYMNRSTIAAKLVLEDMAITDADSYKMLQVNRKLIPANLYSF